jgi:hypothetical protein
MLRSTMVGERQMTDEDRDFRRWYGRWDPLRPSGVADLLDGLPIPWWIVGGWAVDAFTHRPRAHDDIDVGVFDADLPALVRHVSAGFCLWANTNGTLRPLRRAEDLPADCRQLWLRRDGDSPWLADLALTPHAGTTWIFKRDERLCLPLEEATFTATDGIRYLRPELVLAFRARVHERSADRDFETILPLLDAGRRAWLREMLERVQPGDPWIDRLRQ